MAAIDSLPGDQRAVLQLVLGRGRSYAEIARLLSINPDAVRERALAATDALGPESQVPAANRQLICDYLLGQLPADEIPAVHALLADSAPERGWARGLSGELAGLSAHSLPEIPMSAGPVPAPSPADPVPASPAPTPPAAPVAPPAAEPAPAAVALGAAAADPDPAPAAARGRRRGRTAGNPKSVKPAKPSRAARRASAAADEAEKVRSSRRGGMVVIAISVIVVAVVIFVVTRHHSHTATASAHVTQTNPASATQTSTSVTSASTTASTSGAKVITQINLSAASSASKAAAIADVLQEGTQREVAIVGQNVPANTKHNSYEVWLYNSPSSAVSLGFVDPGVTANGKLSAAGALPADASKYHELIVTTETVAKPTAPGPIVLAGTISGL